jgi:putative MFS transporter
VTCVTEGKNFVIGVLVTLCKNLLSYSFHSYQSELFPTRIRSRAIGFVYSWSRLSAALSGLVVAFLRNLRGVNAVFSFIAFAMAIVVATIGASVPVRAASPSKRSPTRP